MAYFTRVYWLLAGVSTVIGLLAVAPMVLAESTDPTSQPVVDPNEGFSSPDGGSGVFGDSAAPMDLIHRAILMNDMSLDEFRQQQQGRLSDEAVNFRQLQQRAIQEQGLTQTVDSEVAPTVDE